VKDLTMECAPFWRNVNSARAASSALLRKSWSPSTPQEQIIIAPTHPAYPQCFANAQLNWGREQMTIARAMAQSGLPQ